MKFLIVALALVACAHAEVSELFGGYNYQEPAAFPSYQPEPALPLDSYVPPAQLPAPINSYIPPAQIAPAEHLESYPAPISAGPEPLPAIEEPLNEYIPPAAVGPAPIAPLEEIEQLPVDGYRYKTVRRTVYRNRA